MTANERLTLEQLEEIGKHGFLATCLANKNSMGLTAQIAEQCADLMRELDEVYKHVPEALKWKCDKIKLELDYQAFLKTNPAKDE